MNPESLHSDQETSNPSNDYFVLAFYHLASIENPDLEVEAQKNFIAGRSITCRLYVSAGGINGQMSAYRDDAIAYMEWMQSRPLFQEMPFKIHYWHEHVFPRQQVKKRKELVALGREVDFSQRGTHLKPAEWKEMLESEKKSLLIDVRNSYEYDVGHFKGAENPECDTFKEFTAYTEKLADRYPEEKPPVMMYCTGGIRCEFYSVLLKEKGFEEVYQLEGGVIDYGIKEGGEHWKGKLFVFDDRMTVPIAEGDTEKTGKCMFCETISEHYYNCANMECNRLFLSCPRCLEERAGCCSEACKNSTKIRPYHHQDPHKPFKKYYHYFGYVKDIKDPQQKGKKLGTGTQPRKA